MIILTGVDTKSYSNVDADEFKEKHSHNSEMRAS